jgi:hypothetical protein
MPTSWGTGTVQEIPVPRKLNTGKLFIKNFVEIKFAKIAVNPEI